MNIDVCCCRIQRLSDEEIKFGVVLLFVRPVRGELLDQLSSSFVVIDGRSVKVKAWTQCLLSMYADVKPRHLPDEIACIISPVFRSHFLGTLNRCILNKRHDENTDSETIPRFLQRCH